MGASQPIRQREREQLKQDNPICYTVQELARTPNRATILDQIVSIYAHLCHKYQYNSYDTFLPPFYTFQDDESSDDENSNSIGTKDETLESDPMWTPYKHEPTFDLIHVDVQNHISGQDQRERQQQQPTQIEIVKSIILLYSLLRLRIPSLGGAYPGR
jgi:hypothetical protein